MGLSYVDAPVPMAQWPLMHKHTGVDVDHKHTTACIVQPYRPDSPKILARSRNTDSSGAERCASWIASGSYTAPS